MKEPRKHEAREAIFSFIENNIDEIDISISEPRSEIYFIDQTFKKYYKGIITYTFKHKMLPGIVELEFNKYLNRSSRADIRHTCEVVKPEVLHFIDELKTFEGIEYTYDMERLMHLAKEKLHNDNVTMCEEIIETLKSKDDE